MNSNNLILIYTCSILLMHKFNLEKNKANLQITKLLLNPAILIVLIQYYMDQLPVVHQFFSVALQRFGTFERTW